MNPVTRRIFLKPSGYTEEQIKRFGELLSAALRRQKTLSDQSPYILAPTSEIIESDIGFAFEHEPARGLAISELFDPQSPPRSLDELNRACSALVYGLRAAHSSGATIHGGVCPGVLVIDPSGLWKLTDFGFAPAVLAAFDSDAFLHLAVGPSASHPDVSAAWEITPDPEEPRDERLWSFVDPNRYASALQAGRRQPARFDPISDVISAGFVLYILADRVHPYLKSIDAAEEFRIASYWDMLPTGRPRDILRKDLLADPNSALFDWWKNFVPKAIERKPEARKTIEELAVRLASIAPPIDAEQLLAARRAAEAVKWIAALEDSAERRDWAAIERQLASPPAFIPSEGVARVATVRDALEAYKREQAEFERQRLELADWTAWLDSIQSHVDVEQWDPAAEALKLRRDRGLAACPESLRSRWQTLTAAVRAGREERDRRLELAARTDRANAWLVELRAASDAFDVDRIQALGEAAPDTSGCESELVDEVNKRAQWARELRSAIAADLALTNEWFARAEAEAGARRWDVALDMLEQLPELSFPPDDLAMRIERLRTAWRQRLETLGNERRAAAEAFVHGLVEQCVRNRLANRVQPEMFDTVVRAIVEDDAGGTITTTVEFTVGWSNAASSDAAELGKFECTIGFEDVQPRLLSDAAEITGAIASSLTTAVAERQRGAIPQWNKSLQGTFLGGAKCDTAIESPATKTTVTLTWAQDAAKAGVDIPLEWDPRTSSWRPEKDPAPLARLVSQSTSHSVPAIEQALREKAPAFDAWRALVEIAPPQPPALTWDRLPAALQFNTAVAIRPPGAQPEALVTAQVAMPSPVRVDVTLDARALRSTLEALLLKRRKTSIDALGGEIQARIKKTPVSIKSNPDIRATTDNATWTLSAKGLDPLALSAGWKFDALAFVLPPEWQKLIDDYAQRASAKPRAEPPPAPPKEAAPVAPVSDKPVKATPPSKPTPLPVETPATKTPKPSKQKVESTPPTPLVQSSESAPPRKRRGLVGITVAVAIALVGGTISWFATRPKPAPVDPREVERVAAWFDERRNMPESGRTDAWYAALARDLENSPARPSGMSADDYDRRLEELRTILRSRPVTPPPPDPRLAVWRAALDDARRELDADRLDQADAAMARLPESELHDALLSEYTALKSDIARARARSIIPTQPDTPPVQPQWPPGWNSNLTLARVVSELLGNLWDDDFAAALPRQPLSIDRDMSLTAEGALTINLRDNGFGLPSLTAAYKSGDARPVLDAASQTKLVNWVAGRVLNEIVAKAVNNGDLARASAWKERLSIGLFDRGRLEPALRERIGELVKDIPDPWKALPGYTAGPLDAATGYPATLTEIAGAQRIYRLVRANPRDPAYAQTLAAVSASAHPAHAALRNALDGELKPENIGPRIYYLTTTVNSAAPANAADSPTLAEWFAAVASQPSLRTSGKTWCQNDWACGSAELNVGGKTVQIPEMPKSDAEITAWLANPLTCQQRDPEDRNMNPPIAGYRGILRFWPKP